MRLANGLRTRFARANAANANEPANAPPSRHRPVGRLRALTFDSWLFVLMLAFVAVAVSSQLYVSYTSLRYVFEVIGGMPPAVSFAAPFGIDASVAAGLLGEWWLAGRRRRHGFEFAYMVAFGLTFALITIAGNALHGALALTVQQPPELRIGGQVVALPWWISIAISAIPGLAIAAPGYAMALIVAVWRRERGEAVDGANDLANRERDEAPADDEPDSHDDSQPRPPSPPRSGAKVDPRVLRLARGGADWKVVAARTGMKPAAAQRALTAARKQIRTEDRAGSQDGANPAPEGVAA